MTILSDDAISELISERKPIPEGLRPLTRLTPRNQHLRREYEVRCVATGNNFVIKLRKNLLNTFDFSVVLGYQLPGINTIFNLRRYNGNSHYHTNHLDENIRSRIFHIHTATERYQKGGSKPEHFAQTTTRFADFDGAITCLLSDCGFRQPIEESPIFTGSQE